jgi:hypothetical protein
MDLKEFGSHALSTKLPAYGICFSKDPWCAIVNASTCLAFTTRTREADDRCYNTPTSDQFAALIEGSAVPV